LAPAPSIGIGRFLQMNISAMTPSDRTPLDLQGRVQGIVAEVLSGQDEVYIVEIDIRGQKGSRVVNVHLESDGPLDVERLASISREVSFVLETEDVIAGRYHLNVSSPGADRPLKQPRQFKKHVGRQLAVVTVDAGGAKRELIGELIATDDGSIELKPEKGEPVRITYQEIETAQVRLPW
jgi:ribosome maturation factor RimP